MIFHEKTMITGKWVLSPGTPNNQFFYGCFKWMIPISLHKNLLFHQTSFEN